MSGEWLTEQIERMEHVALDPRTPSEWGHSQRCVMCILLRRGRGETTAADLMMVDAAGRPLLMP